MPKEKSGMIFKVVSIGVIAVAASVIGKFVGREVAQQELKSSSNITKSSVQQLDLQQGASTLTDLNVYQDDKFPFSIQYPKGWIK